MDYSVALLIFGILLLLVGLVGKVRAKELEIGTSSKLARVLIGLIGATLVVVSFNPSIVKERLGDTAADSPPTLPEKPPAVGVPTPTPDEGEGAGAPLSSIDGRYTMDKQSGRVILISRLAGNEYRIEERTSPWPWTGTAVLEGNRLSGRAHFPKSEATMKVEGTLRGDRSIEVEYHFITKGDGSLADGRIDRHIWFPE